MLLLVAANMMNIALAMAGRRGRLDAISRHRPAGFLRHLPVGLDSETVSQAWMATRAR